jgi:hypothetical protein
MEPFHTRLAGNDFSMKYDMTKTYHESDSVAVRTWIEVEKNYRSLEGVINTVEQRLTTEYYRKMQDGSLNRWLCKGIENYSHNSVLAENMGNDTYRRVFDMGIVIIWITSGESRII